MNRTLLPKAFALTVLTAGLAFAGAQQAPPSPDPTAAPPQAAPMGGRHHHAPNPHREAEHLAKKLNLTPDQTSRLEPILADREQKVQALRQNTALTPEDRHQQMHSIMQDTQGQMAGVLTPDQMMQLKAMRHDHRGHHGPDGAAPADTPQQPS